jgi:hypothetical protein
LLLRLLPAYVAAGAALAVSLAGLIGMVEMVYHYERGAEFGEAFRLFGVEVDVRRAGPWLAAGAAAALGLALLRPAVALVRRAWADVHARLQEEGA